ncbi:hypothetical protein [Shewanella gaetbuli]
MKTSEWTNRINDLLEGTDLNALEKSDLKIQIYSIVVDALNGQLDQLVSPQHVRDKYSSLSQYQS